MGTWKPLSSVSNCSRVTPPSPAPAKVLDPKTSGTISPAGKVRLVVRRARKRAEDIILYTAAASG